MCRDDKRRKEEKGSDDYDYAASSTQTVILSHGAVKGNADRSHVYKIYPVQPLLKSKLGFDPLVLEPKLDVEVDLIRCLAAFPF